MTIERAKRRCKSRFLTEIADLGLVHCLHHVSWRKRQPDIRTARADDDLLQFQHLLIHIAGYASLPEPQHRDCAHLVTGHSLHQPGVLVSQNRADFLEAETPMAWDHHQHTGVASFPSPSLRVRALDDHGLYYLRRWHAQIFRHAFGCILLARLLVRLVGDVPFFQHAHRHGLGNVFLCHFAPLSL